MNKLEDKVKEHKPCKNEKNCFTGYFQAEICRYIIENKKELQYTCKFYEEEK